MIEADTEYCGPRQHLACVGCGVAGCCNMRETPNQILTENMPILLLYFQSRFLWRGEKRMRTKLPARKCIISIFLVFPKKCLLCLTTMMPQQNARLLGESLNRIYRGIIEKFIPLLVASAPFGSPDAQPVEKAFLVTVSGMMLPKSLRYIMIITSRLKIHDHITSHIWGINSDRNIDELIFFIYVLKKNPKD